MRPDAGGEADANEQAGLEAGPPHIQFIGRFDKSDPVHPRCALAGCRIVVRFNGTTASATLVDEYEEWMDGAPSEWDVMVDGVVTKKIVMTNVETNFVLASGLNSGDHVVELYKRTEPLTGTTRFVGYELGGGTLLSPPARKTRRVEVIGDSSSAGFGIEGVGSTDATGDCPGVDHAAKWENFHKAYGAVLGQLVDAEVVGNVHSGKGISKNLWRPDLETLPVLFTRAIATDPASTWNFQEWNADVVIIMAGGNDFAVGEPADDGATTVEEFAAAYGKFVSNVRAQYPNAQIVLTVPPSVDDAEPPGRETRTNITAGAQMVVAARKSTGDDKVWFFEPGKAVAGELTACLGHGNPAFHQRVANELAAFIKPKMGW